MLLLLYINHVIACVILQHVHIALKRLLLQGKLEGQLHAGIMQTVMLDAHGKPTFRDHLCPDVFAYAGRSDSVFHQTSIGH